MPTYKNNTASQIYWRNILWEPGEIRALTIYVPATDLGLTETAATPAVASPVLLSEDVTLVAGVAQTKAIPYSARVQISAMATTGTATLTIGTKDVPLDSSADYVSTVLPWDKVASIGLISTAGATVRLLVEGVL
ncbi:MAG: hypothetical protein BWX80_03467 [Candidatus Hydrogenedentes bacterium ADurb.Bin101]|nr:MAG: hypothetical protein BWX80_03467 [Candidatus Hydrogenedentes bacterium ADurb.Bin101]